MKFFRIIGMILIIALALGCAGLIVTRLGTDRSPGAQTADRTEPDVTVVPSPPLPAAATDAPAAVQAVTPGPAETASPEPTATPEPTPAPDSPAGRAAALGLPAPPDIDIDSWEYILANGWNNIETYSPQLEYLEQQGFDYRIIDAMKAFVADARAQGLSVYLSSGYRDYNTQNQLYQKKIREVGSAEAAARIVLPPGTSEHQTGLCCDITDRYYQYKNTDLQYTAMFKYMSAHCTEYGFIVRYPEDKQDITGVMYEPWHFRYVGVEAAEYMTENNLCLEEFVSLYRPIYSAQNPAP